MAYGFQAAVDKAADRRRDILIEATYLQKLLGVIWADEFKIKQDFDQVTDADIGRLLSGKLAPFRGYFAKVFAHANAVVEAGLGGLPLEVMRRSCLDAERAMDQLLAAIRTRRPVAKVNAERSKKANAVRHKENHSIDAYLRDWYARWRENNPGESMAAAARAAEKEVPLDHRTIYGKIRKF